MRTCFPMNSIIFMIPNHRAIKKRSHDTTELRLTVEFRGQTLPTQLIVELCRDFVSQLFVQKQLLCDFLGGLNGFEPSLAFFAKQLQLLMIGDQLERDSSHPVDQAQDNCQFQDNHATPPTWSDWAEA